MPFLQQPGRIIHSIPLLGVLVLGIRKLMPTVQAIFNNWAKVQTSRATLTDVLELLDQPLPADVDQPPPAPMPFQQSITLNKIGFHYADKLSMVLSSIELSISRGSRVGFIGSTGSGKSTLLDIVIYQARWWLHRK